MCMGVGMFVWVLCFCCVFCKYVDLFLVVVVMSFGMGLM